MRKNDDGEPPASASMRFHALKTSEVTKRDSSGQTVTKETMVLLPLRENRARERIYLTIRRILERIVFEDATGICRGGLDDTIARSST